MNIIEKNKVFLGVMIICIGIYIAMTQTTPEKVLNWNFRGIIQSISYNDHNFPTIKVANKEYDLYYTIWDFDFLIHQGDYIIKKKGDLRIRLIPKGSRDTIMFNKKTNHNNYKYQMLLK